MDIAQILAGSFGSGATTSTLSVTSNLGPPNLDTVPGVHSAGRSWFPVTQIGTYINFLGGDGQPLVFPEPPSGKIFTDGAIFDTGNAYVLTYKVTDVSAFLSNYYNQQQIRSLAVIKDKFDIVQPDTETHIFGLRDLVGNYAALLDNLGRFFTQGFGVPGKFTIVNGENDDIIALKDNLTGACALRLTKDGTLKVRYVEGIDFYNALKGRNFWFEGDSITTAPRPQDGITDQNIYWAIIRDVFKCNVVANGIAGSSLSVPPAIYNPGGIGTPMCETSRLDTSNASFIPDGQIIFGGTNDLIGRSCTLGTMSSTGTDTIIGAMKFMFSYLQRRNKISDLFFVTPLQRATSGFPATNTATNLNADDMVHAMLEVCFRYGVKAFNAYSESGFNYENMYSDAQTSSPLSPDKLHPNIAGHKKFGLWLGSGMNTYYKNKYSL
ncbi:SGNH/GDSL hydrolase family protein [Mucilaginibacter defluvii]|uniref:SGNH hydrolase-type esterase domain-containing protein n=1 Tax=Mucilaginibacter defluvii TaxID=1196019 RepID=A0ABP9FRN0_9SPHI